MRVAHTQRGSAAFFVFCLSATCLTTTLSRASPQFPSEDAGVVLSGSWPLAIGATTTLRAVEVGPLFRGQKLRVLPFVSGAWSMATEQLSLGGGSQFRVWRFSFAEEGSVDVVMSAGASALLGVGTATSIGARVFNTGFLIGRWRWFRAFCGPRLDAATLISTGPGARASLLLNVGAGFTLRGIGTFVRAEGGYTLSPRFSKGATGSGVGGGVTGRVELGLVVPLSFP